MISYGSAPGGDEIEVTLFGPGYGEAIAVHLGDGAWLLIDSCIDPSTKKPASLSYLDQIGVSESAVKALVVSHWHDDHVRGVSQLAKKYSDAELVISGVFNNDEATAFLAAYSGSSSQGLSRGTRELHDAIKGRARPAVLGTHRSIVYEQSIGGFNVLVTALSPLPTVVAQSILNFAKHLPSAGSPISHAPKLTPNFEAIAIHIDFGVDAVLLGSDLEECTSRGWSAVVADTWSGKRRPGSLLKVAHHGSKTGECEAVWKNLMKSGPVTCMTPFTRGRVRLPADDDLIRIKSKSSAAFLSSGGSRKPTIDQRILKRIAPICKSLSPANSSFGAVRFRKKSGSASWTSELFGAAKAL